MLYFLVYNDNTHLFALQKLLESVKTYGKQFQIIVFDKNNIDSEFKSKYNNILNFRRGGGYWLWKPYIINELLKKMNDNDIVFYLDANYYFVEEFTKLYEDYMKDNDFIVWRNKPNEQTWFMKNWCKMDVIQKYNMYNKIFIDNIEDCWAGAMLVKKTNNTVKYIQEWLDRCCIYEDITDSPSILPNHPEFKEHRHDQSLLSSILQKYNIETQLFEKKYLQNTRGPW
jgi:hypothetical protein